MDTIRDEIAACMEKSFDKIQLLEAAKMLSISNINNMKEYGKKVRIFETNQIILNFFPNLTCISLSEELGVESWRLLRLSD